MKSRKIDVIREIIKIIEYDINALSKEKNNFLIQIDNHKKKKLKLAEVSANEREFHLKSNNFANIVSPYFKELESNMESIERSIVSKRRDIAKITEKIFQKFLSHLK